MFTSINTQSLYTYIINSDIRIALSEAKRQGFDLMCINKMSAFGYQFSYNKEKRLKK